MQYRNDRYGNPVSALAYGCMRFTKKGGKFDYGKAEREILTAIELGVNYFDTAYVYGGSEELLGKVFERNHCREQICIADKLPHYLIRSRAGLERIFQEQLRRLRTGYIDYYLMHMLTDRKTWEKLAGMGVGDWIAEKKRSGEIRQIGFSYHGSTEKFCELLDAYDWDFCMIQYNYLDENSQAGRRGLKYAAAKGIPVMIMEPLRGGRLVTLLPPRAKKLVAAHPSGRSAAEWAFRWLWNQPEVTAVLSGMNSVDMVRENCRTASGTLPGSLTVKEEKFIGILKREIERTMKVGCTGCGYCMPCPKGVDIPGTFSFYNQIYAGDRRAAKNGYLQCTVFRKDPSGASLCAGCGRCERLCPQGLPIREDLAQAARELEDMKYRAARTAIRWLRLW